MSKETKTKRKKEQIKPRKTFFWSAEKLKQ
jgi:hypothetical protein